MIGLGSDSNSDGNIKDDNNNDDNDNDRIPDGRIQKSDNSFWPQSLANEGLCASWVPVLKVMPPISNQPASHCLSINAHDRLTIILTKITIIMIMMIIIVIIVIIMINNNKRINNNNNVFY